MTALLPDAAELTDQLEHARATREHLDAVIAWLEQGIALLSASAGERGHEPLAAAGSDDVAVPEREQLPAPAEMLPIVEREPEEEPVVPPAAAAPKNLRLPSRAGGRDAEAKILSAVLVANGPLSRAQIVERTGLPVNQVKKPLQRLVADGRILAEGATVARRYRRGDHQPHTAARARIEAGLERSARKIDSAVARVGLRDRVMKAVSADPAALDNQRLALALNATLEDIADACEYLVGKNKLQIHGDGTYLRSVAEAAREVAAA